MSRRWKIVIFEFLATSLTTIGVYFYLIGKFVYYGNIWWIVICTLPFAYLLRFIVEIYLDIFVCLFTRVRILPSKDFAKNISPNHKAALTYCVRAQNGETVTLAIDNMESSLKSNQPKGNLFAIYVSDTCKPKLILQEILSIKRLQSFYGGNKVIYFHRRENWGKKWGAYQDLMLWLHKNCLTPTVYVSDKYGRYKRDPTERVFSLKMMEDELSNRALVRKQEIKTGIVGDTSQLQSKNNGTVKYLLISDADVIWHKGSAIRVVEKMAHEANRDFAIFQPDIRVKNANATLYTKMLTWSRDLSKFMGLAFWKIYEAYTFYGKGGINIQKYLEVMLKKDREVLPPSALSHDYIESRYLLTAYLPEIQISEEEPLNYLDNLNRLQRWAVGDLIGIYSEIILPMISKARGHLCGLSKMDRKPTSLPIVGSRIMHAVCRFQFSAPVFAFFLFFTLLGGYLPGTYLTADPIVEVTMFWFIMIGIIALPRTLAPLVTNLHLKAGDTNPLFPLLLSSPLQLILSTLLLLQHLVDQTIIVLKAFITVFKAKIKGRELKWETYLERRRSLEDMSYLGIYKKRLEIALLGLGLPLLLLFTQPLSSVWYMSPIWLSFLLGPGLSKFTAERK